MMRLQCTLTRLTLTAALAFQCFSECQGFGIAGFGEFCFDDSAGLTALRMSSCNEAKRLGHCSNEAYRKFCHRTCGVCTSAPTKRPTRIPTKQPSKTPTKRPTGMPTRTPTKIPTRQPTMQPTAPCVDDKPALVQYLIRGGKKDAGTMSDPCAVVVATGFCRSHHELSELYCRKSCAFCTPCLDDKPGLVQYLIKGGKKDAGKLSDPCSMVVKTGFCSSHRALSMEYCRKTCKLCSNAPAAPGIGGACASNLCQNGGTCTEAASTDGPTLGVSGCHSNSTWVSRLHGDNTPFNVATSTTASKTKSPHHWSEACYSCALSSTARTEWKIEIAEMSGSVMTSAGQKNGEHPGSRVSLGIARASDCAAHGGGTRPFKWYSENQGRVFCGTKGCGHWSGMYKQGDIAAFTYDPLKTVMTMIITRNGKQVEALSLSVLPKPTVADPMKLYVSTWLPIVTVRLLSLKTISLTAPHGPSSRRRTKSGNMGDANNTRREAQADSADSANSANFQCRCPAGFSGPTCETPLRVQGYTAYPGYSGVSNHNDIKCGGFATQAAIMASCNAHNECGGFSRDSDSDHPLRWWCTKSSNGKGAPDNSTHSPGETNIWFAKDGFVDPSQRKCFDQCSASRPSAPACQNVSFGTAADCRGSACYGCGHIVGEKPSGPHGWYGPCCAQTGCKLGCNRTQTLQTCYAACSKRNWHVSNCKAGCKYQFTKPTTPTTNVVTAFVKKGAHASNACPTGYAKLTSEQGCKDALARVVNGKNKNGEAFTITWGGSQNIGYRPSGCYTLSDGYIKADTRTTNDNGHFNTHPTGSAATARNGSFLTFVPLCAVKVQRKPLAAWMYRRSETASCKSLGCVMITKKAECEAAAAFVGAPVKPKVSATGSWSWSPEGCQWDGANLYINTNKKHQECVVQYDCLCRCPATGITSAKPTTTPAINRNECCSVKCAKNGDLGYCGYGRCGNGGAGCLKTPQTGRCNHYCGCGGGSRCKACNNTC